MKTISPAKHRGRPREFDPELALDKAMRVFWKFGYEGTSLLALTAAMGISRPSLYAAFGSKEQLFRKALDHYTTRFTDFFRTALNQPTAREAAASLLHAAIASPPRGVPRGCLLVQGALACSSESTWVRDELARLRNANEQMIHQRFQRASTEGDLPAGSDPAALAKYIATVMQGLAVQTATGADHKTLAAAVEIALNAWPAKQ
jgi:AcrR family transcriptional regulator